MSAVREKQGWGGGGMVAEKRQGEVWQEVEGGGA